MILLKETHETRVIIKQTNLILRSILYSLVSIRRNIRGPLFNRCSHLLIVLT